MSELYSQAPDLYLPGQSVVALARDKNLMEKSGQILTDFELAQEYKLFDGRGSLFKLIWTFLLALCGGKW